MKSRASAGYSGTPLPQKLGIKAGMRMHVGGAPSNYHQLIGALPDGARILSRGSDLDFVHLFLRRRADLAPALRKWRKRIQPAGMIWISWPKKSSGVASDITEDIVRQTALANGLVDIKVCAVDETWSGLKLVIPVAQRGR